MQLLIFRTPAVVLVLMMRLTKIDGEAHLLSSCNRSEFQFLPEFLQN